MKLRLLDETADDDLAQSWGLSRLAFGGDPAYVPSPPRFPMVVAGAFDDGDRLVAKVVGLDYQQWWGGRQVPMLGIAGVTVLPEHRGQGLLRPLMDLLLSECGQPVSALFPTAPGIYRRLGWEVVGSLDHTPVPLSALPRAAGRVRAATEQDTPTLAALYAERGAHGNGLLTRTGPSFPDAPKAVLDSDVVSVVEEGGRITGYVSYDRGRGYRGGGQLRVWDCVTTGPGPLRALLGSLSSWDAVVDTVLWRGRTDLLGLELSRSLGPPTEVQPWMLRVTDPVAAVSARGFAGGSATAAFALGERGYRLEVADGRGRLSDVDPAGCRSSTYGASPSCTPAARPVACCLRGCWTVRRPSSSRRSRALPPRSSTTSDRHAASGARRPARYGLHSKDETEPHHRHRPHGHRGRRAARPQHGAPAAPARAR